MKKSIRILEIILSIFLICSCTKDEPNPSNSGKVTDIEGNVYSSVTIGTQVWMKENLKTTKYNDGTAIPLVTDGAAWDSLSTPAYCWYNNDSATYKSTYGALYNWFVVDAQSNGGKNVCPTGWHVPSDEEWDNLTTYLGGDTVAAGKLKETGTTHWASPNAGATNKTGFTALPGGIRGGLGLFYAIGFLGGWWTSTGWYQTGTAIPRYIEYNDSWVDQDIQYFQAGMSIRCLKDI